MPRPMRAAEEMGVNLRPMTDGDMPFVAALYASTRRDEVAQTGWPAAMQEAFLRQQHEAQHSHYTSHFAGAEWLIVEQAGEAIGRLYLHETSAELHVIDISLVPECRGHGIGAAILGGVMARARDKRIPVTIYVEKTNPARRLYQRLGFELVEDQGVYDLMRAVS